jgi:hypothetical protein
VATRAPTQPFPKEYPLRFSKLRSASASTITTPTFTEDRSLEGSASRICADTGEDVLYLSRQDRQHTEAAVRMARKQTQKPSATPLPGEGIKPGTCRGCGMVVVGDDAHRTAGDCISYLRGRLAKYER